MPSLRGSVLVKLLKLLTSVGQVLQDQPDVSPQERRKVFAVMKNDT